MAFQVAINLQFFPHNFSIFSLPIKKTWTSVDSHPFEQEKECSSTWDENEERNLYEGLINVFPADYNPLMFAEEESGKLQVLSKLLAVIHELCPDEK